MIGEGKLKIKIASESKRVKAILAGVIDEDADLSSIVATKGPLILNLSDVQTINSLGVRAWVNFIKDLGSREVWYEECPPAIVRQLNMIPSFMGHAKVLSAYATYVCSNCDAEALVLVEHDKFKSGKVPDPIACEECKKGKMEFDGQPQQYFAFAK